MKFFPKIKSLFTLLIITSIHISCFAASISDFNEAYKTHNNLVNEGKFEEALPFAKKSYQLSKELFEPLSNTRLVAIDNYALNLQATQQLASARKVFLELLNSYESKYGKHAKELMQLLNDITAINAQLTNEVDAEEAKAIAIRKYKLYLRHNSDTVVSQFVDKNLSTTMHASNTLNKVKSHFEKPFSIYESEHWSIIYPTDKLDFVKNKMAKLMERTYQNNISFLVALGLRNKPVDEKMTAVYMGSKADYASYIKAITGDSYAASNSGGLYNFKARAFFVFDRGTDKKGKEKHASPQSVVHEVSHQVLFESGFQSKYVVYPRWFTEGMAVSFEHSAKKKSYGPHTTNYSYRRAKQVKRHIEDESLITMRQLITFDGDEEAFDNALNQSDVYALGSMLIRFLYTFYPDEFKEYLAIIAKSRTAKYERAKFGKKVRLKQFSRAFRDPDELQSGFETFINKIINQSEADYKAYKKQRATKKSKSS